MIMKGQKINDRYQIIKSIGEGGMANVYLALDTILDRNVAVKVLRGDLAHDEKFVRRFQREALAASSLSHPNVVEVYDVGEDNGNYYIVMEYIEGRQLKQLLKKREKLTLTEVIDIMLQITDGMSVAHDAYIIHRDIKPQNIMILDNGMVKITDFGIAMAMNSTQLTQTNSVMGSVHYLPPEQANGKSATLQSDIYSMGILMYELLSGKLPYKGDNAVEIALKHLKEPFPSIREIMPEIPQSVENIILKATAKNPKNRYADAREMYDDIRTCLDESRENEEKIKFKFPEGDNDTNVSKALQKKTTSDDEGNVIAEQITESDVRKDNKIVLILATIFTGIVAIITAIIILLPIMTNAKEVKIPDVTNMSQTEAVKTLQDAGFKVADQVEEVASDDVSEGKIVKTKPVAGAKKTKGSEVTLYASSGNATYTLEDYTGKNYLTVQGTLEAYGVYVLIEKKDVEDSNSYEGSEVIDQSIKAGEKVSAKDTVILYIPNIIVKYPDFTSYTIDQVKSFCEKNDLNLVINPEGATKGKIKSQDKAAGSQVRPGTTLKITVEVEDDGNSQDCDGEFCGDIDPSTVYD
ncbi:MAG: Stk1 family PASTA domain-containing Ser/Thr kinase [Bacilli bacterium]|nr:Stk1 family PASTA domain-containing Ser/Thr kinase [Bacilli bacterium]